MRPLSAARVAAIVLLLCAVTATVDAKRSISKKMQASPASRAPTPGPNGILVFTRFNCAFPFCPTTALDVCSADEHYEPGRPYVLATLIPQTVTSDMNFFAYSDFDNSTRMHYTLAARSNGMNQLFTVHIGLNGTVGALVGQSNIDLPSTVTQAGITYLFTYGGLVYVAFAEGVLVSYSPKTGALVNTVSILPASSSVVDSLGSTFDHLTGTFYVNGQGDDGFYLHSYNVATAAKTMVGPLPPAAGTAGPNNTRVDNALASLVVYPPASVGGGMKLMEMRNSPDAPWLFMAWLDPVTGVSTQMPLPDDWYQDWEVDPQIFPTQWAGSTRRVWSYDPINNYAWFKLYDECGGEGDDCTENDTIVALAWVPPVYVDWYVAVEPVEPQLTQLIWVWTNKIE